MGDRDGVGVTETVPVGVSEPVAPMEGEEELEGGPVVDVGDTVLDPVHDRLPVGVGLGVRVDVKVAVGVKEGVTVLLRDAPEGSTTVGPSQRIQIARPEEGARRVAYVTR